MSEDGYTLVEMLVALAIIGLAFGGLSESARAIGRLQHSAARATSDAASEANAQRGLQSLLTDTGPFISTGSGGFAGGPDRFSFACEGGLSCGAQIRGEGQNRVLVLSRPDALPRSVALPPNAQFRYADANGEASGWPNPVYGPIELAAVSIIDPGAQAAPVASVKLGIDEPPGCVFDVVAQACRAHP